MAGSMKDNGKTTWKKEKDMQDLLILQFIKVHIRKANHMDMENMNGKMVKFIKDNG